MNFKRIEAAEVKLWDFSAYFWNAPRMYVNMHRIYFLCMLNEYFVFYKVEEYGGNHY